MLDFSHFLIKSTSIITLIIPLFFSTVFIIYECFKRQTDKKYFICFAASLILGYFTSFWNVRVSDNYYAASLHIVPLFMCFLVFGTTQKWSISWPMTVAFCYLQVLFVDLSVAYKTDMVYLFMTKAHVGKFEAQMINDFMGPWYNGIGGAGWSDALFLAFILPLIICLWDILAQRKIASKLESKKN